MKHSRLLPLLPPLLIALAIFIFSSFGSEGSDAQSGFFVDIITSISPSISDTHLLTTIVRKTAHLTEYALLGFFTARAFAQFDKSPFLSLPTSIAYAITDEFHQAFVPGRAARFTDILIDSIGVIIGTLLYIFIHKFHHKLPKPAK